MMISLPESLARGANLLRGKPIYVKVGIPQSLATVIYPFMLMASSIKTTPPKAEEEVSMTTEVKELVTHAVLDASRHGSMSSTPKRLNPMVMLTPPPQKLGDISSPVDTSSQVGAPDNAKMGEASLEEIPPAPHP